MVPCPIPSSQTSPSPDPHPHFSTLSLPSVNSVPSALKSPFAAFTHAPLASGPCKSPHRFHSMGFIFPLFSYSYALFCTMQSSNSFSLNSFRTLCTKHPGWGPGRASATSLSLRPAQQRPQLFSVHAFTSRSSGYPGWGHRFNPAAPVVVRERVFISITSLPPYFVPSPFFPWNNSLSRTSSQVQR
jgi:hypothetical protein